MALGSGLAMGLLSKREGRSSMIVLFLLLGFAGQLTYDPRKAIPSQETRKEAEMRVKFFRQMEEPLFAPCHPYMPIAAGKKEFAFWGTIFDIWITPGETSGRLKTQLLTALEERRFRTVILKEKFFQMNAFPFAELKANYREIDSLRGIPGKMLREYRVYIPKPAVEKSSIGE